MNSLSLKAAALVLLGASQGAWGQITECGPSSNDGFEYEVAVQDAFTVHWTMDPATESITFQVVTDAMAWTSLAFSSDGFMVGSDAVIGLPDDASVQEYEMTAQSLDAVLPFEVQEITEASVSQEAATTTITFTRPLVPTGDKQAISAVAGDETILVWAYGVDNTLAYHGSINRGSLTVDLFCGEDGVAGGAASTGPSIAPTPAASAAGVTGAPTLAGTEAPAAATAAPALGEGATMAPTMTMMMTPAPSDMGDMGGAMDTMTPAPVAGDRAGPGVDTSITGAPTAVGVMMTAGPSASSTPVGGVDGDGQDTDGASPRAAGGRWTAAAVAGVVTVLAALSL